MGNREEMVVGVGGLLCYVMLCFVMLSYEWNGKCLSNLIIPNQSISNIINMGMNEFYGNGSIWHQVRDAVHRMLL